MQLLKDQYHGWIQRHRDREAEPPPPHGKSQVAVDFLKNSGTDHSREAIGPLGDRSVWPSVKYVNDKKEKKTLSGTPLMGFSGSAYKCIQYT